MPIYFRRRSYAASTKAITRSNTVAEEQQYRSHQSKRHSLGSLPDTHKLDSILSSRARSLSGDRDSDFESAIHNRVSGGQALKLDENLNERAINPSDGLDNRTLKDISNHPDSVGATSILDSGSIHADTRSPAERSLAKLFEKRQALNRAKAQDTASSPGSPGSPGSPEHTSKESEKFITETGKNLKEQFDNNSSLKEQPVERIEKFQTAPGAAFPDLNKSKGITDKVEAQSVALTAKTKDKVEEKEDYFSVEDSLRPRSASHSEGDSVNKSILRPRSATHTPGQPRPHTISEPPPRPPPRRKSPKKKAAAAAAAARHKAQGSRSSQAQVLSREEKASRRISSPPALQSYIGDSESPSSSANSTPVTSPGRRRPSRKKSPAPLPPGFVSPGSADPSTTGKYGDLGRSDRSVRRSGSLDNILSNFGDDSEGPVPPPRIKRRQRIGLADIRGGKKSGSDSASASGSESPDRGRYAYRKQGLGNVVAAASHDKYDLATEPSYLTTTAGNYDFALTNDNNNIPSSLQTSYLEKLAEMEQKKLELERLRRKYTGRMTGSGTSDMLHSNAYLDVGVGEGDEASLHEDTTVEYQNVELSQPFSHSSTTFTTNIGAHGYPSSHIEDNVKTVLRFDREQDDSNKFLENKQISSPERDSLRSRIKETSLSPERSHLTRFKDTPTSIATKHNANNNASKVVLNFNEDHDDSQSYEDVILLNKKKIGDDDPPIPQTFIDGREEVDTWAQSVDARGPDRPGLQAETSALARESQAAGASNPSKTNRFSLHLDTSTQLYQPGVDVSPRSGMTAEEEYTMSNRLATGDNITKGIKYIWSIMFIYLFVYIMSNVRKVHHQPDLKWVSRTSSRLPDDTLTKLLLK